MKNIPYDLIFGFALGLFFFWVVGIQLYFGKVYTRGRRGVKIHEKSIVSREEAPYHFWIIIGLQSIIGLVLVLVTRTLIYDKLT